MLVFLLWIYMVAASEPIVSTCPKLETLFDKTKDCNAGLLCDTPILSSDKKSFICPAEWNFEARVDRSSKWNRLASVKCEHGLISATRIGKMKSFDYEFFRCAIEACSVDTKAAFKASVCLSGDTCQEANPSKEPLKLSCPIDSALEVQKPNGRWIELSDNRCVGSTLTSTSYDGEMKVYRCRTLRKCDVNRYYPKTCGLKEKCSPIHSTDYICDDPSKIQVSFTNEISWQEELQVVCDNDKLSVKNTLDIPIALRCVADAVCEADEGSLDEKTCEKGDPCREITKSGTTIKCPNSAYQLEHHARAGEPWQLINAVDCYNTVLIDRTKNIQGIKGLFRCRKKRRNDMAKYRDDKECEPTKKCVMPIPEGSGIDYKCPIDKNMFNFDFQAKLTESGPWIDIDSVTFKDEAFVIREKGKTVDNEFIPIQFRCIREATCEVDISLKFNPAYCPANDNCEIPTYNTKETQIGCPLGSPIEFQSAVDQPWKELTEIVCYNQIMEPKRGPVQITSSIDSIRCRKLRTCDIDKYYDPESCDKKQICSKPDHLAASQCPTDYRLQFKSLENQPWADIDKIECSNERFVLIDNPNAEREEIPISFRCMLEKKCNIDLYYDQALCQQGYICEKPSGAPKLTCSSSQMILRVKHGLDNDWNDVQSIECKSDAFEVLKMDGTIDSEFPLRIQCLKKRSCIAETPLKSDCASDDILCGQVAFSDKEVVNCVGSVMVFEASGGTTTEGADLTCNEYLGKWEVKNAETNQKQMLDRGDKVICKFRSCIAESPLKSDCANDYLCGQVAFSDKEVVNCAGSVMFFEASGGTTTKGTDLACNGFLGKWEVKNAETNQKQMLDQGDKVICKFNDCDYSAFCANCKKDINSPNVLSCKKSNDTMLRKSPNSEYAPFENTDFMCKQGKWETVGGEALDDGTQIDCVDCDFSNFCSNCTKYDQIRNAVRCENSKETILRNSSTQGFVPFEKIAFVCKYGRWETENGKALDASTQIDCVEPTEKVDERTATGQVVAYIFVFLFVIIALVVLILYLFCRLKTDRWLHTIVKEKMAKKEKKKNGDRKSPAMSSSPIITPKTNEVENSQGPVSDSPAGIKGNAAIGLSSKAMENSGGAAQ